MFSEILKLLASGIVGAIFSGYFVTRWKAREDAIEKRLDEICSEIKAAADESGTYWQLAPEDDKLRLAEARTLASIGRIDGLRSVLAPLMSLAARNEMTDEGSAFLREATGETFGVKGRASDTGRASRVHQRAASFTITVRRSRMRDLSGWWRRK